MTANEPLAGWIRGRSPAPPAQLLARIDAMTAGTAPEAAPADALIDAAAAAMMIVLREGCLTRSAAIDLLSVDALITYAFEAAADDPARLEARTRRALARIAALAGPYEA